MVKSRFSRRTVVLGLTVWFATAVAGTARA
jgi:hypothetical protein